MQGRDLLSCDTTAKSISRRTDKEKQESRYTGNWRWRKRCVDDKIGPYWRRHIGSRRNAGSSLK